ncbi:MAG: glycosyltransferase family 2 protein [Bacteroidia bacterium]|nr:glycosyltransferase family 2 protein [Bacteroidia bacterium]
MFVSGFTFIRNAITYDYPIIEAITSILPICDELIIAVGNSDDNTLALIESINSPKIKIIETVWDDNLRQGGHVLAVETNKALAAINKKATWAFYIQGDEAVHEKYLDNIKAAMQQHAHNQKVEGLLFKYMHFYGSYDYVGDSRRWYRNEVRIVRPNEALTSYKDAQGFQIKNRPLNVKPVEAYIYHYGWVRPPDYQQKKQRDFNKLWHDDAHVEKKFADIAQFDYTQIDSLAKFTGTHPKVMQQRIERINWEFDFDPTQKKQTLKNKVSGFFEKHFNWRPGEYKNYKLLK